MHCPLKMSTSVSQQAWCWGAFLVSGEGKHTTCDEERGRRAEVKWGSSPSGWRSEAGPDFWRVTPCYISQFGVVGHPAISVPRGLPPSSAAWKKLEEKGSKGFVFWCVCVCKCVRVCIHVHVTVLTKEHESPLDYILKLLLCVCCFSFFSSASSTLCLCPQPISLSLAFSLSF